MEQVKNFISENKEYILLAIVLGVLFYFLFLRRSINMRGGANGDPSSTVNLVLTEEQKKFLTPSELAIFNAGPEEVRKYFQSILDTVKNIVACKDVKDEAAKIRCLGDNHRYYVLSVNRNDKEGLGEMYHSLVQYSTIKEPTLENVKMNFLSTLVSRMALAK